MKNKNIIIFSSDDWGWKTSKYQLSVRFAKDNKVLFVSSIGFRAPTGSSQDLGRIMAKLKSFLKGVKKVEPNLYVLTPLIIPFDWFPFRNGINRMLIGLQIRISALFLKMRDPAVFVFSQNWYPYISSIRRKILIYYRVDEHSGFDGLDKKLFQTLDRKMSEVSDLIICSARSLYQASAKLNPASHYLPHGVDYELFSSTLDDETRMAEDMKDVGHPLLMFIGHISYDWVDASMLKFLAEQRPHWYWVLVGRYSMNANEFDAYPNIIVAGEKQYETLPGYCKSADVGIIPFVDTELTRNCNPLKLPEYVAAGLPVVSTNIPEVARAYSDFTYIGHSPEEFLAACEMALRENDAGENQKRSKLMEQNSWDNRVAEIYSKIDDSLEGRSNSAVSA